jgi:CCR4-NOT transcriptional regulation complex NOT5 subunit
MNMIEPSELQNRITTLQEKLPPILDDFKKYYVFFNKNPTYSEYQTIYANLTGNINSIANELSSISNDVITNSQNIGDALLKINPLIENEKTKYNQLKKNEGNINNEYKPPSLIYIVSGCCDISKLIFIFFN